MEEDAARVLEFWLGEPGEDGSVPKEVSARWWKRDDAFDAEIRERFGELIERALAGDLDGWKKTPRGRLALVILLDQFTRNVHRGTGKAFAGDARAKELVEEACEAGDDRELGLVERYFLYMPLMHTEEIEAQERCVEKFRELAKDAPEGKRGMYDGGVEYAVRHRDIVARFGRFPHRNELLGRETTDQEREFLKQPGSSF